MRRNARRSLPQSLAFAVAKAVATTIALFGGYVGTAVFADLSSVAEGRRTPPAEQPADGEFQAGFTSLEEATVIVFPGQR